MPDFKCLFTGGAGTTRFEGACLDTGATRTVVGRPQADAYSRLNRGTASISAGAPANFLFGGVASPSLGTIDIRVPLGDGHYTTLAVDVVEIDVPFLLGLDTLDALSLYVNNVDKKLECDDRGIAMPLYRKGKHLYLEWDDTVHYTTSELERLHK